MQQKMRGRIAFARGITNYKVRNEKKPAEDVATGWVNTIYIIYFLNHF